MLNIAKAIGLIAASVVLLGSMDTGALIQGVLALGAIAGILALMVTLITNLKAKRLDQILGIVKLQGIALAIAGMAVSLAILVVALKPFANMNWDQYAKVMAGLGGVLLELLAFMLIIKAASIGNVKLAGFIGFALSVGILVLAIKPFAGINWEQYAKMMAGLAGVIAILFIAMKIVAATSIGNVKLAGFIGFALSIGILVLAIQPFANMSWEQYAKVMAGLGGVLLEMLAVMLIVKATPIGTTKLAGFIGFAVSIWLLVRAVTPFAKMSWEQYAKVMAGLGGVLLEMLAVMLIVAATPIGTVKLTGFIAFAASILLLVEAIKPFAKMSWEEYAKCMAGLGGVLLEMIAAMAIMTVVPITGIGKLAVAFIAVGLAMRSITGALNSVKNIKWETILAFSAGLSILLVAIAGASALAAAGGFAGIIALAVGLAAILGVIGLLAPWLMGNVGSGLADMGSKLAIMADMLKIFSDRMQGVDEGSVDKAQRMIELFKSLLGDIGTFGTMGLSASAFSTAMFNLGTGLEIFSNHTQGITTETGAAAIQIIKDLAGCANDLDIITKLNIDALTAKISGLGGAMMLYAKGAKEATGIEGGEITDVSGAVTILNEITTALAENGGFTIPENMPSEDALGTFGAQLAALAGALVMFEEAGAGLGDGTAEALKTLTFFKDLKEDLVEIDFMNNVGYIGELNEAMAAGGVGVTELETFGANIEQLGLALKSFAESTTTVDEATGEIKPTSYDEATEALTKFSDLANNLPQIGGIRSWWEGNRERLSELGSDIQQLGSGLMTFSNKISGQGAEGEAGVAFDATAATSALGVVDAMVTFISEANTKLPRLGGLANFFTTIGVGREQSFKDIGDQIGEMGDGLGRLGQGLNTGGWSKDTGVNYALDALSSILDIMIKFQEIRLAAQQSNMITGDITTLSDQLAGFIEHFTIGTEGIQNMVFMMSTISDEFKEYGDIDPANIDAFMHMAEALTSLASVDPTFDWKVVGLGIDTGIAAGLLEGTENVKTEATNVIVAVYSALVTPQETVQFETVGMFIDSGIALGITNNQSMVTIAAENVAIAAYNSAMAAIDAGSPSRLFMQVGSFLTSGFAIGINQHTDEVGQAAAGMSEEAVNSARDVIGTISRVLAEDVDAQPTISPVLDMSNAVNSMADFNRNLGRTINLDTAVAASIAGQSVSAEGSNTNQNRSNFDGIYERMSQMNEELSTLGTKIANMRLVLDTGVLAGGVTDGVDMNIGRRQFYAARRN